MAIAHWPLHLILKINEKISRWSIIVWNYFCYLKKNYLRPMGGRGLGAPLLYPPLQRTGIRSVVCIKCVGRYHFYTPNRSGQWNKWSRSSISGWTWYTVRANGYVFHDYNFISDTCQLVNWSRPFSGRFYNKPVIYIAKYRLRHDRPQYEDFTVFILVFSFVKCNVSVAGECP